MEAQVVLEAFIGGQLYLPHKGGSGIHSFPSTREDVLSLGRGVRLLF